MILALRTDTPICEVTLIDAQKVRHTAHWEAGRELAKGLLAFIEKNLEAVHVDWNDLTGIIVFKGPGSFTGLRIGIAVVNTIAYTSHLPIVGETSEDWIDRGMSRLEKGRNDQLVVPEYGAEPHITQAKK